MKNFINLLFVIVFFVSCSPLETARVLGIGVKEFETHGKLYTKTFKKDAYQCYRETLKILSNMEALHYRGDFKKRFIVAIHFHHSFGERCIDSTEVAIFFREVDADSTQVEVSSLNYPLSGFVAEKLFAGLEK